VCLSRSSVAPECTPHVVLNTPQTLPSSGSVQQRGVGTPCQIALFTTQISPIIQLLLCTVVYHPWLCVAALRAEKVLEKFSKAYITDGELLICKQDATCSGTDNRRVYLSFTYPGGRVVSCIGLVKCFVRAQVDAGRFQMFLDENCIQCGVPVPKAPDGTQAQAKPLHLAVLDLFRADACEEGAIGCRTEENKLTGEIPNDAYHATRRSRSLRTLTLSSCKKVHTMRFQS
jgi:hypothetical protein